VKRALLFHSLLFAFPTYAQQRDATRNSESWHFESSAQLLHKPTTPEDFATLTLINQEILLARSQNADRAAEAAVLRQKRSNGAVAPEEHQVEISESLARLSAIDAEHRKTMNDIIKKTRRRPVCCGKLKSVTSGC
jgi:hypothetical protein